jgi:hypothetical protein
MKNFITAIICICLIIFALLGITACAKTDIVGISVYDEPHKTTYVVGEQIDITGCNIKINYKDGSSKTVGVTESMVSGFDTSSIGKRSFTITYTVGKRVYSTTQEINTIGRAASSLSIITPPDKTSYVLGQRISLEGIEVEVEYNNGEVETVGASALIAEPVLAYLGQSLAAAKKDNASVNFNVTVVDKAVAGINIMMPPDKTEYFEGELFDQSGMIIGVVYNDDTTAQLNEGFDILDSTILAETEYITVSYQDYTVNCPIEVSPAAAIDYEVIESPKTAYVVGDTVDTTGIELEIEYNNGIKETVKQGEANWLQLEVISPSGQVEFEDDCIILHYVYGEGENDYLAITIDITVSVPILTGFKVMRNQNLNTEYDEGEPISLNGLELNAVYNNGSEVTIIDDVALDPDVTYDPYALITMTCVTISYKGLTYQFDITVNPN